jgi:predicted amidohydrolase
MAIVLGQPDHNINAMRMMAAEAARRGSDLIVFPELWSTGYDLEHAADYATPVDQGFFAIMGTSAREFGIHILGSSLSLMGEGHYGNTAVLFDPEGRNLGIYTKIHLFRLMEEERYLTPGEALGLVDSRWGKVGLSICYDLRFPELFRSYGTAGAKIVFVPSEWPHPRLDHWRTLLKARAIENQLYVIACNCVGTIKGSDYFGHSMIIDPWGDLVVEGGDGQMILTAQIDLDLVDKVRAAIPVYEDRRPSIYLD